ncbi:hypothetical protein [Aquella oligotrophica]|uniref:hypothetical protein n=1 Tax=Aquella oligotrophica TaxID=2067065 RepID=UPI0013150FCE|nr:hypothetical protein [Aquella oligotrophica]
MPHLILECSDNIIEENRQLLNILHDCQQMLVENLPTSLESCKSRVVRHQDYLLGNGEVKNAFIHLEVRVLKGRSEELLKRLAEELKTCISARLLKSLGNDLNLKLSVEVVELSGIYVN